MKIICENQSGEKMGFGASGPCWLISIGGLGSEFNVYTGKNSGQDGEIYNGSDAKKRNIVFVLEMKRGDFPKQSSLLYSFFQKGSLGTLYCCEDGMDPKKIGYYVEKAEPDTEGFSPGGNSPNETRNLTVSLICPNPQFYALKDSLTQLAVWQGCIRFPLRIREPFSVTEKINTLIGNVRNDSAVPMGLTVKFMASGTVTAPSLYDINRRERMQINATMHAGDEIVITTGDGNKRVQMTSGGVTANISNLMQYPPKWLKAYQGDNLFRYNAGSGIDGLSVSILSTQAYWGA